MIQITRAQARLFRTVLRKSIPSGRGRSFSPPLSLQALEDGVYLRSHDNEVAVEWHLPGAHKPEIIALPSKALDSFEGTRDTKVSLALKAEDTVKASWEEGGIPQSREYSAIRSEKLPPFPAVPAKFASLNIKLLHALDDAAQTVGKQNVRYAMSRLQLRGTAGEIVSSDGGQLLLQRGFTFPWQEDVLIPAIDVFGWKDFIQQVPLAIGRTDTHVCLQIGAWKIHLTIDKEARYPRVEHAIPLQFAKGTVLRVATQDASFLSHALQRLPGGSDPHAPVTVDLNGGVAIRTKAEDQSEATELLLNHSEVVGSPLRFVANRQYMDRAVRLGFAEFFVKSPDVPIVCRDPERLYVFMPLSKDGAIPPSKDVVRIESTGTKAMTNPPSITPRRKNPMPAQPNGHPSTGSPDGNGNQSERNLGFADLITEAEELRAVLQDAGTRLSRLITGLKQHRRQSRAVQDAVRSLKQLSLDA